MEPLTEFLEFLIEPLHHPFMIRAFLAGILTALTCASLSTFVVWRRMSFIGDAVSHAILPGIVLSYVLQISFFWGALGAALLVVISIGIISQFTNINEDAAIGVVFTGFFSLGILIMSHVASFIDLNHILFGNILGVSKNNLIVMNVLAAIVLIVIFICCKEIITASFDPSHAAAIGLSPVLIRYILLTLMALTTVLSIQVVGVVLVLAFLVTPGSAASLLTRRSGKLIFLSIIMAEVANLFGFYASYYMDIPAGPAIVFILSIIFVLSAIVSRFKRL